MNSFASLRHDWQFLKKGKERKNNGVFDSRVRALKTEVKVEKEIN